MVERFVEYWNTGDFDGIEEVLHPDFSLRMTPKFEALTGIESFKNEVLQWRTSYPDFRVTLDETIYADSAVISRWTITGMNTGLGQHPPTGMSVDVPGMSIIHIKDGKILDEWIAGNNLLWLRQLGYTLVPPFEQQP
jgi:predicted ester cyclase